jgi:hypothetical protein
MDYTPGNPTFRLFVPKQAVGANLVYFDLFTATSAGIELLVLSVIPIVSGAVAVTGVVGVDLILTYTTAIGTGGTAATYDGTDTTACTISGMVSKGDACSQTVTARLTPTGGATAGAVIGWASVKTEETNAATYFAHNNDLVRRMNGNCPAIVRPGNGIRVVQGAVASVGNIGFDVIFQTRNKN